MNTLTRSWALTKTSFGVMRQDPELLVFPVLSAIFSIGFVLLMFVPTVFVGVLGSGDGGLGLVFGGLELVLLFISYFVLAFFSTFFNVCVVFTAKTRFEGGNATFMQSFGFALSRVHQIAAWSLVSATVGLIMRGLDQMADRDGIVGLVFSVLRGILGFAWAIVQLFVIPAMVYEGVGPIDAIKRSAATLRETWGESLVRHYGLGLLQFIVSIPLVLLLIAGFYLLGVAVPVGIVVIGLAAIALIVTFTVFGVLNTIYNTALYHFAATGSIPSGWEDQPLEMAFTPR